MRLSLAVLAGLLLAASAQAGSLESKDFKTDGWRLTVVPLGQTVDIAPAKTLEGKFDAALTDGTPTWNSPVKLPGPAWAYGALRPETLVVTPADKPDTKLVLGKDFALDPKWATITGVKGSAYPAGTKVHMTYQYGLSRIDLIEQAPDGRLVVVKGVDDKTEPLLPAGTPGNKPIASVYLPNGATALDASMINVIDPAYDGVPPVTNREHLKDVKDKLAAGKPVTIVFLGDSITAQGANSPKDFRDGKGSYVDRFTAYLKEAYPQSKVVSTQLKKTVPPEDKQITVVMSGVGGNDTPRGLARMDTDVLAHKPDVLVVMFGVNDENRKGDSNVVPVPAYKANLTKIVSKAQAAGSKVIVMTTSMKNLGWAGTAGNLNEYAEAARAVAAEQKVCLVDNFKAWEQLPRRGYNYMVFLGNCINHPVDLGHDVFFRGLKSAFAEK